MLNMFASWNIASKQVSRLAPKLGSRLGPIKPISRTGGATNLLNQLRFYATPTPRRGKEVVKVRYIFITAIVSTVLLVFVAGELKENQIKKKNQSMKKSFTEKEYAEQQMIDNLKRRHQIIDSNLVKEVKILALPFVHLETTVKDIIKNPKFANFKVETIDLNQLAEEAQNDESNKFSFLLQDLAKNNEPFPKGLTTGLLKEYFIKFSKNYSLDAGNKQPTAFILKNYPQTTEDAIKFENDIGDIALCIVDHYDMVNELPKDAELERNVNKVIGYFDIVSKSKTITSKKDEMDAWLKEIMLEDI